MGARVLLQLPALQRFTSHVLGVLLLLSQPQQADSVADGGKYTSRQSAQVRVRFSGSCADCERPLPWASRELASSLRTMHSVAVVQERLPSVVAAFAPDTESLLTITLLAAPQQSTMQLLNASAGGHRLLPRLGREDFVVVHRLSGSSSHLLVLATDGAGATYGALELAERIGTMVRKASSDTTAVAVLREVGAAVDGIWGHARFGYRAVKINLPWSPYRGMNEPHSATAVQMSACRNLSFWEDFLDLLARSRFNLLSIWSEHPWPFMIRPHNFPQATPFNDTELASWKILHSGIFKLARDRAITPALVDWNVFVSDAYKQHYEPTAHADVDGGSGPATVTALANQYNREAITQTLQEYPDLQGIGLSLGDRVSNLNLTQQLEYARDVIIAGVKAADRRVKLIYRAPFGEGPGSSNSPAVARSFIEKVGIPAEDLYVQIKFNWSHGHSLVQLIQAHGGGRGEAYYDPPSSVYQITWMVRNEDFFFLRWGGGGFIRKHIAANGEAYVGGYAIGSEGNIPAFDYAERQPDGWMFEKQWLWYQLWGRLLYDPNTSQDTFAAMFDSRYGLAPAAGWGQRLLRAHELVSIVPLRIASFVYNTWDYTLHAEGFIQGVCGGFGRGARFDKGAKGFISLENLIYTPTLDPTLQSITAFVSMSKKSPWSTNSSLTSPLALAAELSNASNAALQLIDDRSDGHIPAALNQEANDVVSWAALGHYFALKLRAAVLIHSYRTAPGDHPSAQGDALDLLSDAEQEWTRLVDSTAHLKEQIPLFGMPGKLACHAMHANTQAEFACMHFMSMIVA